MPETPVVGRAGEPSVWASLSCYAGPGHAHEASRPRQHAPHPLVTVRVRSRYDTSKPELLITPGYGDRQRRLYHYSQAVKIGNRLETSGQGSWSDDWQFPESIADEIAQAFRDVERTLAVAGAGWEHVVHVNSYHVGLDGQQDDVNAAMTTQFRHYMPAHAPIWTCLGVVALGDPQMRVEIRVTAILPD